MSCNCTGTIKECIKSFVGSCDLGINTGLVATQTGNHLVMLMLNDISTQFSLSVDSGDLIVMPNTINNSAVFEMQIFQPDNTLLNDTCYSLRTIVTLSNANSQIPPSPAGIAKKFITVPNAGDTVTDVFFATHTITEIDTSNQVYLETQDFTQSGATITWVNGNTFYAGQLILAKA